MIDEIVKYSDWEYEESDEQEKKESEEESEEKPDAHSDEEEEGDPSKKKSQELSDDTEVEVNGEKMTLAEVKKGYMRQSDYTKKTQELSKSEKKEVVETAKKVVENPEEYPEEDVKAAEYLLKILKAKHGLMTRAEYDAEKAREKQVADYDSMMGKAKDTVAKMKGMPAFDEEEVVAHMKETGIYNALAAYKDLHETEYLDYISKQKKGNSGYKSEKGGEKPDKNKKEFNVRTSEGHRDFLMDEISKIKEKE